MKNKVKTRTIKLDYLARVEGEGALYLKVRGGTVEEVRLKIFEPPRFFEALLRGRSAAEAPDITARICGICPVAYQMSAVQAVERISKVQVGEAIRDLRRLLYCGEWIESHALHIHMLHAPDFLGYADAISMAKDHPDAVTRGLRIKKAGNALMSVVGGREIHPINVRLGGFYKTPAKARLQELRAILDDARNDAEATIRWVAALPFPDAHYDCELVALRHASEYPITEGRIVSTAGLDLAAEDYEEAFEERQAPYSNALQSVIKGRGAYCTGPMARFALNYDRLPEGVARLAAAAGIGPECRNPFKSIIIRSVEVFFALTEAVRLIDAYVEPPLPAVAVEPCAGVGHACTEAPRGLLYHRYRTDERGDILDAKIVPPTSQNQLAIEEDLRRLVPPHAAKSTNELRQLCERAIRNYDPCISCATHFLKLELDRDQ